MPFKYSGSFEIQLKAFLHQLTFLIEIWIPKY